MNTPIMPSDMIPPIAVADVAAMVESWMSEPHADWPMEIQIIAELLVQVTHANKMIQAAQWDMDTIEQVIADTVRKTVAGPLLKAANDACCDRFSAMVDDFDRGQPQAKLATDIKRTVEDLIF